MEPAEQTAHKQSPNYDRVRSSRSLWKAWANVRENGLAGSRETRRDVLKFEEDDVPSIQRIARQLRDRRFSFGAAVAKPIRRPGKKPRPIVVASVEARIVQRALLDELQALPGTRIYLESDYSFGCVLRKSRADAIAAAQKALSNGARYFVRSDIKEFFTRVPRKLALDVLRPMLDVDALTLLEQGTTVELANAASVDTSLFPTEELGVAQGHCLSPLLGNIVLHDFDRELNTGLVRCLRYVDDFLILGPNERAVLDAFAIAQRMLQKLGMTAYDPRTERAKAERGDMTHPFDFLGCSVQPGLVGPNKKSRTKVLARVQEILQAAEHHSSDPSQAHGNRASLQRVLYDVGNVLRGWRDSFNFCEHAFVFNDIEDKIDKELRMYLRNFHKKYSQGSAMSQRLLLGLPALGAERA